MTQRSRDSEASGAATPEHDGARADGLLGRRRVLAALGVGVASAVAGCTGGDGQGGGTTDTTATPTPTTGGTTAASTTADDTTTRGTTTAAQTVQVRSVPEYGDVLVGPDGMSLYMFDRDAQGSRESVCYDDCAGAWPPLLDDDPASGGQVTASLSTFERRDGAMQVAANGWPLYYYAPDEQPGDVKGQGAGEVWWLLRPDGTVIRDAATTTTEATTDAAGGALTSPIELGAQVSGWVGRSPTAIDGDQNPTLTLQTGRSYELTIVGADSAEHDVKIEDDQGEDVVESESIEGVDDRATVRFTARQSFSTYYCDYHESSMRGRVDVVE